MQRLWRQATALYRERNTNHKRGFIVGLFKPIYTIIGGVFLFILALSIFVIRSIEMIPFADSILVRRQPIARYNNFEALSGALERIRIFVLLLLLYPIMFTRDMVTELEMMNPCTDNPTPQIVGVDAHNTLAVHPGNQQQQPGDGVATGTVLPVASETRPNNLGDSGPTGESAHPVAQLGQTVRQHCAADRFSDPNHEHDEHYPDTFSPSNQSRGQDDSEDQLQPANGFRYERPAHISERPNPTNPSPQMLPNQGQPGGVTGSLSVSPLSLATDIVLNACGQSNGVIGHGAPAARDNPLLHPSDTSSHTKMGSATGLPEDDLVDVPQADETGCRDDDTATTATSEPTEDSVPPSTVRQHRLDLQYPPFDNIRSRPERTRSFGEHDLLEHFEDERRHANRSRDFLQRSSSLDGEQNTGGNRRYSWLDMQLSDNPVSLEGQYNPTTMPFLADDEPKMSAALSQESVNVMTETQPESDSWPNFDAPGESLQDIIASATTAASTSPANVPAPVPSPVLPAPPLNLSNDQNLSLVSLFPLPKPSSIHSIQVSNPTVQHPRFTKDGEHYYRRLNGTIVKLKHPEQPANVPKYWFQDPLFPPSTDITQIVQEALRPGPWPHKYVFVPYHKRDILMRLRLGKDTKAFPYEGTTIDGVSPKDGIHRQDFAYRMRTPLCSCPQGPVRDPNACRCNDGHTDEPSFRGKHGRELKAYRAKYNIYEEHEVLMKELAVTREKDAKAALLESVDESVELRPDDVAEGQRANVSEDAQSRQNSSTEAGASLDDVPPDLEAGDSTLLDFWEALVWGVENGITL